MQRMMNIENVFFIGHKEPTPEQNVEFQKNQKLLRKKGSHEKLILFKKTFIQQT